MEETPLSAGQSRLRFCGCKRTLSPSRNELAASRGVRRLSAVTGPLRRSIRGSSSAGTGKTPGLEGNAQVGSPASGVSIDVRPVTSIAAAATANSLQARASFPGGPEHIHLGPALAAECKVQSKAEVENL